MATSEEDAELWSLDQSWPVLVLLGVSAAVWLWLTLLVVKKALRITKSCYGWLAEWWEVR